MLLPAARIITISILLDNSSNLLSLRYSGELTMDEIGQIYGISRMAVSKRLQKLHKKLGSSVS
ncbi:sigma factor-like helix-turn-helix DNA-binding protein [Hominicoprocola fusiformis]